MLERMPQELFLDMGLAIILMMGFGLLCLGVIFLVFTVLNFVEETVDQSKERCKKHDGPEDTDA